MMQNITLTLRSLYVPADDRRKLIIYGDPAASGWDAMLTNHGWNFKHADNDVIEGIRYVLGLLNTGKYFIDYRCKKTKEEYDNYGMRNIKKKGKTNLRKYLTTVVIVIDTHCLLIISLRGYTE